MANSKLETKFKKLSESVGEEIQKKLDAAQALIKEAEDLAEKHGIPFYASISPLGQSYFPTTFTDKWSGLDSDFVSEITGVWSEYEDYGWQHSQVC